MATLATHRGTMWHHVVPPPAIPIEFRCPKCPNLINLRQDAGSTVWHKAWHIKNEAKISRLPVSSPFRAFDNSVASICTWKGLEKLECANSPYLCRLEASHLSKLPFLGTKHFVSDFLPFLPFDLKTIPNLLIPTLPVGYQSLPQKHMEHFSRYLCMFFIYIFLFAVVQVPRFVPKYMRSFQDRMLKTFQAIDISSHGTTLVFLGVAVTKLFCTGDQAKLEVFSTKLHNKQKDQKRTEHSQQSIKVQCYNVLLHTSDLIWDSMTFCVSVPVLSEKTWVTLPKESMTWLVWTWALRPLIVEPGSSSMNFPSMFRFKKVRKLHRLLQKIKKVCDLQTISNNS